MPTFANQATTSTITATFATVPEDAHQLFYKIKAKDTANAIKDGDCVIGSKVCTVIDLTPGRKNLLSVQSCISGEPTISVSFSNEATSYTVPRSKYWWIGVVRLVNAIPEQLLYSPRANTSYH